MECRYTRQLKKASVNASSYTTAKTSIRGIIACVIHLYMYIAIPSDAKMNDTFERYFKSSSLHENRAAMVKETLQKC